MIVNLTLDELGSLINGHVTILNFLIRRIENAQPIDRKAFAKFLQQAADEADAELAPDLPKRRFDLLQMRLLARQLLLDPEESRKISRWTPELIQGGLSDSKDASESDSPLLPKP